MNMRHPSAHVADPEILMTDDEIDQYVLGEDDFDALEELLVSDAVPADCMSLEALDGYLAAIVCSPVAIPMATWMPQVWSAHADAVSFESGSRMQKVIRLVIGYHNELAVTLGIPDGWEPFCYAAQENDDIPLASEWVECFKLGVLQWPVDWRSRVDEETATRIGAELERLLGPWLPGGALVEGDDTQRRAWLDGVVEAMESIMAIRAAQGIARPAPILVEEPAPVSGVAVGRNDPCPCGSGKKFKKCCGASS